MRDIKFRAWDVEFKKWYFDEIGIGENYSVDQTRDLIWLQYTGLSDKNGKEIYEGDIVKANDKKQSIFEIVFIDGAFCIGREGAGGDIGSDDYVTIRDVIFEAKRHGKELALYVLGNIFETPELLK